MLEGLSKKPALTERRERTERRNSLAGRRATDRLLQGLPEVEEDISLGPLRICDQHKTVTVYGKAKHLTRQEYELLRILAAEEGHALSRDELAENLGRLNHAPDPDDVKKYIYRLRKKIEPDPCAPRWIQNVRGVGYRLMVDDNDEATRGARSHP